MGRLTARTTVYLNPHVKKFIQHKAVAENRSVSTVINNKFAEMLEDLADQKEIRKRGNQSTVRFESILKKLGLSYDDLRR